MSEVTANAAGPPHRRREGTAASRPPVPAGRRPVLAARRARSAADLLFTADEIAYWLVVAPLAAGLPASLAYRVACWRGDWGFRYRAGKRAEIVRNLRRVLGGELGPEEAERLAREVFRTYSCVAIDVRRLRGRARSLGKLVEIRGREHLDAALAGGRGAILCTAHFGSYDSAFSLLHAGGYPLTGIGRYPDRWFWDFVYTRRVRRHRQRPQIQPRPGRIQVAVQAAAVLRANEVLTICSDSPPLDVDRARAIDVPFLGRQARLLPGVVTLAQLTGAPVLMAFMHRSADYRHQVLEISRPVPVDGETTAAFGRCVAAMDAAIRTTPAQWEFWASTGDLARIGLAPADPPTGMEHANLNGTGMVARDNLTTPAGKN